MRKTPSLRHMTFKQALVYARSVSGMTKEDISEASEIPLSTVARYFQEYDCYSPSAALIPVLCKAMGNTILASWVQAQVEDIDPAPPIASPAELTRSVLGTTINNGELSRLTHEVVADGDLSPDEAKSMIGRIDANILYLQGIRSGLDSLACQAKRGGKGNNFGVRQ